MCLKQLIRIFGHDRRKADEAFVAGVLHDIGKLILIENFYDEFVEALTLAADKEIAIVDAEEQVLGISHAGVGGVVGRKVEFAAPFGQCDYLSSSAI